jgi:hypothetical protein
VSIRHLDPLGPELRITAPIGDGVRGVLLGIELETVLIGIIVRVWRLAACAPGRLAIEVFLKPVPAPTNGIGTGLVGHVRQEG